MKANMPTVTCIIVNWNNWKITKDCIASIHRSAHSNHQLKIIVVDNGSTDRSAERLLSLSKNYRFVLIRKDKNYGFAGGYNFGIEKSLRDKSDFIFLLNNDTVIDKNCISELVNFASLRKDAGIFTPKIFFAKGYEFHQKYKKEQLGKVIWSAGGVIDWNNVYATNYGVNELDGAQFSKSYETDFATGAAMFLRSDVIKKYGMFDERYYLYFEDVDMCERYKRSGGRIMFVPKALVWHKVAQSSAIGSELNDYFITRNRLLFGMGYASWRTKFALYRESIRFLMNGRKWQKQGVFDFFTARFGRGSWV